jgi:polyhydroxyalkanoate synthesis repressor PhaR
VNQPKIVLKKYPNRRLYDTEHSTYVTLRDVARMIREGRHVQVLDAKTEEDVTAFILTQIIMERARNHNSLLPVSLLHLLIRSGEDVLSEFFDKYLERTLQTYLNYKQSVDEQIRICLELGMDMSTITERLFTERSGFGPFFNEDREEAPENGKSLS